MKTYTITIPGKFEEFFSGTSVGQGQPADIHGYASGDLLHERYINAQRVRRGFGESVTMSGLTRDAVNILADYAETCIDCNLYGDPDPAEMRAARKVLAECERLLGTSRGKE